MDERYRKKHHNYKRRRKKKPVLPLILLGLDLALVCAAGKCMYHFFHTPKETVQKEQVTVLSNAEQKKQSVAKDEEQMNRLRKKALEIYERNQEYLVLVNKEQALPADYSVTLQELNNGKGRVDVRIYNALTRMLADGFQAGYSYSLVSAYRDSDYQTKLIQNDISRYMSQGCTMDEALEKTYEQVMPAGYSEHETGLALDITAAGYTNLDATQAEQEENRWMRGECWKYGFIVRYPEDKEAVTKILYEPWHFRYVGEEAAEFLTEENLTLEEFYDLIEEYKEE
ncbi:D-alanyl-D-alanine carboxypeptidase [uncultured Roseburia sp.]|uniref:M15 family metallopeptidase n=1 Tax=Brotonthovivens ammoniilytica TaxID=2981725 RepID=A0ABT2TKX8_9FIRM|nr:M15 family metallopeptidase [Brotonthovivens ammoniilytica]MCU6762831.1 M15 family metallopeptidase [Brotonthovivens ammoniilytica]SCI90486.1 D-alanyl-D-alanine carboxypeptidase [uncultured Roseburia sp.]